jgi:hypothetical protein
MSTRPRIPQALLAALCPAGEFRMASLGWLATRCSAASWVRGTALGRRGARSQRCKPESWSADSFDDLRIAATASARRNRVLGRESLPAAWVAVDQGSPAGRTGDLMLGSKSLRAAQHHPQRVEHHGPAAKEEDRLEHSRPAARDRDGDQCCARGETGDTRDGPGPLQRMVRRGAVRVDGDREIGAVQRRACVARYHRAARTRVAAGYSTRCGICIGRFTARRLGGHADL